MVPKAVYYSRLEGLHNSGFQRSYARNRITPKSIFYSTVALNFNLPGFVQNSTVRFYIQLIKYTTVISRNGLLDEKFCMTNNPRAKGRYAERLELCISL